MADGHRAARAAAVSAGRAGIPILLYHSISDHADAENLPFTVSPAVFAEHLDVVASSGLSVLTVGQLVAARRKGAKLNGSTVVITADDGYADTRDVFAETLLAAGMSATVYVSTGTIGQEVRGKEMLSWSATRDLAAMGIEVGSHGHHHLQLDTRPHRRVAEELRRSRQQLEDQLGQPSETFAYPYGYHTPKILDLVRRAGFESACAVKNALSHDDDDIFALSRLTITRVATPEMVAAFLRGEARLAPRRRHLKTRAWRVARLARHLTTSESSR
jgi:peptidoglycan/xylan/chitin deacetylase (PgdA/CDA1 family)